MRSERAIRKQLKEKIRQYDNHVTVYERFSEECPTCNNLDGTVATLKWVLRKKS